jgi:hypothetical protein
MSKPTSAQSEWQRIWVMLRQRDWTSLAIVPSHQGVDISKVAESLARTGRIEAERPIDVITGVDVQLGDANQIIDSIGARAAQGHLVLVPVDPIADNPSAITIVRATSAALLVVRMGESLIASAEDTIDTVGRDRFVGSIIVDERGRGPRPSLGKPVSA